LNAVPFITNTLQVLAGLLLLVVFGVSLYLGFLMNVLFVFMLLALCYSLIARLIAAYRKTLYYGLWTRVLTAESRPYLFQALLRIALWIVAGICVNLAVVPIQLTDSEQSEVYWTLWIAVAALCLIAWFPRKRIAHVSNVFSALILAALLFELIRIFLPVNQEKAVVLAPPVLGGWYVFHGGNSPLLNAHFYGGSQRWALDLILPEDGPLPGKGVSALDGYQSFGQPILAPIDGTVVSAENALEDQAIGSSDTVNLAGNHVIIQTAQSAFVLLAHLQKGSVTVKTGDTVRTGQQMGLCGNSGNTSQPHLHIHAMTQQDLFSPESRPLPMLFRSTDSDVAHACRRGEILEGRQAGI
jgi:hypothetical protein